MSVNANVAVIIRPYSGYDPPSFPIASYIARLTAVGDVTGGTVALNFRFQQPTNADVTELYNLEQFEIHVDEALTIGANLETVGMDHLAGTRTLGLQRYSLVLPFAGVGLGCATELGALAGLPLWLGRPNTTTNAGLRIEFVNTLLVNYTATIQGFIWGPRAVVAPGGPQRPPEGYFRA